MLATWSDDIATDTTWNGGEVHVVAYDIAVSHGAELTIEPGAIVKFQNLQSSLTIGGALDAQGTSASPIIFTGYRDDVGGDTNEDEDDSTPSVGNWRHIEIAAGGTAVIDQAHIRYGGAGTPAQLFVNGGNLTLSNSTVSDGYHGIRVQNSNSTLTNITFENNRETAISTDLASNLDISQFTFTENGVNALALDGGTLPGDTTWAYPELVYWMTGDVIVPVGTTLEVVPGKVIKAERAVDLIVNGVLLADGTASEPIIFTSVWDDTAGGDTNNDGTTSNSHRYKWGMIQFNNSEEGTQLNHVHVRYAAHSTAPAAVLVTGGRVSLTDCVIRDAYGAGMRIVNSDPVITGTTFQDNRDAAISVDLASHPTIRNTTATGNGINGLALADFFALRGGARKVVSP